MRDVLIGGGGIRTARVGSHLENMPCAPVIVIGNDTALFSPMDASDVAPAEGLWLVDVLPVEREARTHHQTTSVTLSGLGPLTGAGIEASDSAHLQRVALLCEAPLSNPPVLLASITLLASTCIISGTEAHVCAVLHRFVSRIAVLRVGVTPSRAEQYSPESHEGRAEWTRRVASSAASIAATVRLVWPVPLPQLRVLIHEDVAGDLSGSEQQLSPSRTTRSTLLDALTATSPAEIDALIRSTGEALFSSVVIVRCRSVDASAVMRDVVLHAPARRFHTNMAAEKRPVSVKEWLAVTAAAYTRLHGWRHIAGRSSIDEICAIIGTAVEDGCCRSSVSEVAARDNSSLPELADEACDAVAASLSVAADVMQRCRGSTTASVREATEAALRRDLEVHWNAISSIPTTTPAHEWIDGITETLRTFYSTGAHGAAQGNRQIVQSALTDITLQWALPNASAAARIAANQAKRKLDAMAEEVHRLTEVVQQHNHQKILNAPTHQHQLEQSAAAAAHAAAVAEQRGRHLGRLRTLVMAFVRDHSAKIDTWKRRFAAKEFLAANIAVASNANTSVMSPIRGIGAGTDVNTSTRPVDEHALKLELQSLYQGFDELGVRVGAFTAEFEQLFTMPQQVVSNSGVTPEASSITHIDARSVGDADANRSLEHIRAARSAAAGMSHQPPPAHRSDDAADDDAKMLRPTPDVRTVPLRAPPTLRVESGAAVEPQSKYVALMSPSRSSDNVERDADLGVSLTEVETLRSALEKATSALAKMKTAFSAAREIEVCRMEEEIHTHRSRIDEDNATIKRLRHDNTILRAEVTRLAHSAAELEKVKTERDSLEYKLRAQILTVDAFTKDKSRLEVALSDAEHAKLEADRQYQEAASSLRAMRETAEASSVEVQELRSALYASQSAKALAEHNVASLSTELSVVRAESRETEQELRARLQDAEANQASQRREVNELRAKCDALETQLHHGRSDLERVQSEQTALAEQHRLSMERLREEFEQQQQALDAALLREQQAQQAHSTAYSEFTRALMERDALRASVQERDRRFDMAAKSLSALRDENSTLRRRQGSALQPLSESKDPSNFTLHHTSWYDPSALHLSAATLTRAATSQPRPLPPDAAQDYSAASSSSGSVPPYNSSTTMRASGLTESARRVYSAPLPLPRVVDELLGGGSPVRSS